MIAESIKTIAKKLVFTYYEYYSTVYISFIWEAIEESRKDGINILDIEKLHKHIKEYYI